MFVVATASARLPEPYRDEFEVLATLLHSLSGAVDWPAAARAARPWVQAVRDQPAPFWAMESLLREYPISSAEGLALMRLAEALLRVPDAETAIALTADQLGKADLQLAAQLVLFCDRIKMRFLQLRDLPAQLLIIGPLVPQCVQ